MTTTPRPEPRPLPAPLRWLLLALAVTSLAAAVVGLFLPVIPTVPFVLLAAWAAARSSPRLLAWLESHRTFGPPIADWRRGGVVRRRSKWTASVLMAASAASLLAWRGPQAHVLVVLAVMATVLAWLWRRPESFPAGPADPGQD